MHSSEGGGGGVERFGQTCMTKEQSEMLMLMNHPFAWPMLHRDVHCIRTGRNSAQTDFDIEISHCSCSAMHRH